MKKMLIIFVYVWWCFFVPDRVLAQLPACTYPTGPYYYDCYDEGVIYLAAYMNPTYGYTDPAWQARAWGAGYIPEQFNYR